MSKYIRCYCIDHNGFGVVPRAINQPAWVCRQGTQVRIARIRSVYQSKLAGIYILLRIDLGNGFCLLLGNLYQRKSTYISVVLILCKKVPTVVKHITEEIIFNKQFISVAIFILYIYLPLIVAAQPSFTVIIEAELMIPDLLSYSVFIV